MYRVLNYASLLLTLASKTSPEPTVKHQAAPKHVFLFVPDDLDLKIIEGFPKQELTPPLDRGLKVGI